MPLSWSFHIPIGGTGDYLFEGRVMDTQVRAKCRVLDTMMGHMVQFPHIEGLVSIGECEGEWRLLHPDREAMWDVGNEDTEE